MSTISHQPRAARASAAPRIGLGLVAVGQAELAVWALVAPRSFFGGYPGAGHHWVAALGPYNEHLLRDYGGAELGFAVLLAAAALWFERRLVLAAGAAFFAANIPHFAYHLTTTGSFSTFDAVGTLAAFALEFVVVGFAMVAVLRPERST